MTLFKYIRPERVDIVERCEIRFTQPDALNDPFELQPRFESLIAQADILRHLDETPVDLGQMLERVYSMLPESQRAMLPLDAAAQVVEAFMATDEAREVTAQALEICLQSMKDAAPEIRETIYRIFNDNVGLLSLSEVPDHELMWAHYADSHKGLVLCFDEQHPFFNQRRSEHDECYYLRKVLYDDSPAPPLASTDGDALLVTKGTKWAYEREWRMLVPLKERTRELSIGGDKIYLFAFPSEALKGVIFGACTERAVEDSLKDRLGRHANLSHIHLSRAVLDTNTRSVQVSGRADF